MHFIHTINLSFYNLIPYNTGTIMRRKLYVKYTAKSNAINRFHRHR
jgi:hypothetical protein